MDARRAGQRGLVRGLAALALALLVAVGLTALMIAWRVTTDPDLGPPPTGPRHGSSEPDIAVWAAASLLRDLSTRAHATVVLSEQDLTLLAGANNTEPDRLREPEARLRDGLVVLSARTDLGPLGVTAVGRVQISLVSASDGLPDLHADLRQLDAGSLRLPGFVRDSIAQDVSRIADLDRLLAAAPELAALRRSLECVAATSHGLVLGFHRLAVAADPGGCT